MRSGWVGIMEAVTGDVFVVCPRSGDSAGAASSALRRGMQRAQWREGQDIVSTDLVPVEEGWFKYDGWCFELPVFTEANVPVWECAPNQLECRQYLERRAA